MNFSVWGRLLINEWTGVCQRNTLKEGFPLKYHPHAHRRVRRSGTPVLLAQLQLSQRSRRRRGQRSHRLIVSMCVTESFIRMWISMRRVPLHNEDFIPTETPSVTLTLRYADDHHHKNANRPKFEAFITNKLQSKPACLSLLKLNFHCCKTFSSSLRLLLFQ